MCLKSLLRRGIRWSSGFIFNPPYFKQQRLGFYPRRKLFDMDSFRKTQVSEHLKLVFDPINKLHNLLLKHHLSKLRIHVKEIIIIDQLMSITTHFPYNKVAEPVLHRRKSYLVSARPPQCKGTKNSPILMIRLDRSGRREVPTSCSSEGELLRLGIWMLGYKRLKSRFSNAMSSQSGSWQKYSYLNLLRSQKADARLHER